MNQYIKSFSAFEAENFIKEKWNSHLILFLEEFKKYASENKLIPIYRGMKKKRLTYLAANVYQGNYPLNRTSLSRSKKNNFYNLLMDNEKEWENFPKRAESFICTNSFQAALLYEKDVFCVIPVNYRTINIASCRSSDIWFSFQNNGFVNKFSDVSEIQSELEDLINVIKFGSETKEYKNYFKNYEELLELCKFIDLNIKKLTEVKSTIIECIKKSGSTFQFIKDIIKPTNHTINKYNTLNMVIENNNEIWFSDDIIALKADKTIKNFEDFLNNYIEKIKVEYTQIF